jgi:signal transduction histidine kinase
MRTILRLLTLWLLLCGNLQAGELVLQGAAGRYPIRAQLDYLEDPTWQLTLPDVMHASGFRPVGSRVPNLGFTRSSWWFRVTVRNESATHGDWYLENQFAVLDYFDVHLLVNGQPQRSLYGGDMRHFARRDVKLTNPVFALHLARGEQVTLYVHSGISGALQLPLVLWSGPALLEKDQHEQMIIGIYFGMLLAMFLYNLMIFLTIRDRSYLYYLFFLASSAVFQLILTGQAFEYLWPGSPYWGNQAVALFSSLMMIGALQFTRSFLQMRDGSPLLDRVMLGLVWFFMATALATFFVPYTTMLQIVTLAGTSMPLLVIASGILRWRQGARQAKFFLLAWSAMAIGGMGLIFNGIGVLPSLFLTKYGFQIGNVLEAVLLSFAMADRIRLLREEHRRVQQKATQMLEQKVRQRSEELALAHQELATSHSRLRQTHQQLEASHAQLAGAHTELEAAHAELAHTHQRLQTGQQQLFLQKKMAGLGMLTAGVAHEINNPTHFTQIALQNQRVNLARFEQFVMALLDQDTHPSVMAEFTSRFAGLHQEIATMQNGTERISAIVRDLRTFTRQDTAEKKAIHLSACLESAVHLVRARYLEQAEFTLRCDIDPEYECWPTLLNQVFVNLLLNAGQAIAEKQQPGGDDTGVSFAKGRIQIDLRQANGALEVAVTDDGIGMSPEVQARILEPFFTTKRVGSGTGLGLAIAWGIIQKHQGTLDIASTPGLGSRFVLRLPLSANAPLAAQLALTQAPP